jgi:hypothetical protein
MILTSNLSVNARDEEFHGHQAGKASPLEAARGTMAAPLRRPAPLRGRPTTTGAHNPAKGSPDHARTRPGR